MKKAFTFAELMISLVIISVITALLYPTIADLAPNNNKEMYMSAYRTLEDVVASIVSGSNDNILGVGNRNPGEMPTSAHDTCLYFQDRLNTVPSDAGISDCDSTAGAPQYLQTTNGIRWYFEADANGNTIITADVNSANNSNGDSDFAIRQKGKVDVDGNPVFDEAGNRVQVDVHAWDSGSFGGNNEVQDTFQFVVSRTGKITVSDYGQHYLLDDENNVQQANQGGGGGNVIQGDGDVEPNGEIEVGGDGNENVEPQQNAEPVQPQVNGD